MAYLEQNEQLYVLLTDANEDCTPFWDAVWEVAVPGMDDDSNARYASAIPDAQRLIRKLFLAGLIVVHRGDHWPPSANHEVEVTQQDAEEIIADPLSWRHPSNEKMNVYFCFYATASGKQLWHQGRDNFYLPTLQ